MAKVRVNWGALPDGQTVKLFGVVNTSHSCLYVLAQNVDEAMSISNTANHTYGTTQITALDYSRAAHEVRVLPKQFEAHAEAIGVAISQRLRGSLHLDGDDLAIGEKVILK